MRSFGFVGTKSRKTKGLLIKVIKMREFLYKNSFFRYTAAINLNSNKSLQLVAPFISFYLIAIISIASGLMSGSPVGSVVALTASLLFLAGCITGTIRNSAPNLVSLMPLSGKRRCVYDFLAVLWFTFIGIIFIALFIALIAFIAWVVTAVGGGEVDEEVKAFFSNEIGLYGGIFCAAYTVILYSAGMIGGYLKAGRRRNGFFAAVIVAILLGLFFTGLSYMNNSEVSTGVSSICAPFVNKCYAYMQFPWLCVLFWCLIAAGMFATAIYMSWNYHKPKY